MNMPGFTAEASLYTVSRHYHSRMIGISTVEVLPQLADRPVEVIGNGGGVDGGNGGVGGGQPTPPAAPAPKEGDGGAFDDCMAQCTAKTPDCPPNVDCLSWDAGFEMICNSQCSGLKGQEDIVKRPPLPIFLTQ